MSVMNQEETPFPYHALSTIKLSTINLKTNAAKYADGFPWVPSGLLARVVNHCKRSTKLQEQIITR
jgi:hypothetical protein